MILVIKYKPFETTRKIEQLLFKNKFEYNTEFCWFSKNKTFINGIERFFLVNKGFSENLSLEEKEELNDFKKNLTQIEQNLVKHKKINSLIQRLNPVIVKHQQNFKEFINLDWNALISKINEKMGFNIKLKNIRSLGRTGLNNSIKFFKWKNKKYVIKISDYDKIENLKNECISLELIKTQKKIKVPTSNLRLHGEIPQIQGKNKHYFALFDFIEGKPLRELKNKLKLAEETSKLIAKLNQINPNHIGFFSKDKHDSWFTFIKELTLNSLKELYEQKTIDSEKYNELKIQLLEYLKQHKKLIENAPIRFVHNDVGFTNIIAKNYKVVALIDMEFSLAGDPAWDFWRSDLSKNEKQSDHNRDFIINYISECKKLDSDFDVKNFIHRFYIYEPLKNLYSANFFAKKNLKNHALNFINHFENGIENRLKLKVIGFFRYVHEILSPHISKKLKEDTNLNFK